MTNLRPGYAAAILVAFVAAAALGVVACTQGTTPDCADAACGPGPIPVDASVPSDGGSSEGG
jgi:hypothetical protein